ncbi:MAG: branched-chain amino acid ABC transporter permease [Nakamurella sp.]
MNAFGGATAGGTRHTRARSSDRLRSAGIVLGVIVGVGTLVLPLGLSAAQLTVYVLLGTATMVTVGVSLLMGYAGQVSLGQAAFYAIGGYTAALMTIHGLPSLLGLICAPIVAGVVAGVVGIPILRLRGHYLAFATLAMQLILLSIVAQVDFFGGELGLNGIPLLSLAGKELSDPRAYAYVVWIGVALVMLVTHNIIASRPGRGLRALATSETAAESAGVPVTRYRLTVFALSAAFAGLAGAIYAFFLGYIAPGSFPVLLSLEFVVMAVVGGLGTVWGPLVGAAVITLLVQWLNGLGTMPGMPAYASVVFSYAVYAVVLIGVLLFLRRGLLPTAVVMLRKVTRRRTGGPVGSVESADDDVPVGGADSSSSVDGAEDGDGHIGSPAGSEAGR